MADADGGWLTCVFLCGGVGCQSEASVEAALKLNGTLYHDKHLRVDHVGRDASKDYQRSLFLGNLPFDVADEEVCSLESLVCLSMAFVVSRCMRGAPAAIACLDSWQQV